MWSEILFNVHDLVQLMTAALCLMLAGALSLRLRENPADAPLTAFLVAQAWIAGSYVLLFSERLSPNVVALLSPWQFLPLALGYLAQGAALLWYVSALINRPLKWPPVDAAVVGLLLLWLMGNTVWSLAPQGGNPEVGPGSVVDPLPALLISVTLGLRALVLVARHNHHIRRYYSNIDGGTLIWLAYAACGFVAIWIWRAIVPGVVSNYPVALLVIWMVLLRLEHRSLPLGRSGGNKNAEESSSAQIARHAEKLNDLLARVRLYEDPELDLEGLADSMGVSPRTLSQVINSQFGKNFYDLINHYRVEDAKQQLSDASLATKSIQRVFEDAGFNSKSTFNSTFKRATGLTPSQFRQRALRGRQRADRQS